VGPKITAKPEDRDFVIIRIKAIGEKEGRPAEATVELFDHYDEATGFSAMERTTGWDGAIVAIMNARGVTPRGVKPVEVAVPAKPFIDELRRRGFALTEQVTFR
jgi:lysine 6-dehydrogenase